MSSDKSDEVDIKRGVRSMYARGNMLVRRFCHCSIDIKQRLFQSLCSPIYCIQLWSKYHVSAISSIRVAYNNCFRHLFGFRRDCSISHTFVNYNLLSFQELQRSCIYSFINELRNVTTQQSTEFIIVYIACMLVHCGESGTDYCIFKCF